MGQAYKVLPYYTYEDYRHWEGQWELIEGIPYAMSPAPGIRHQDLSGNMYSAFKDALKRGNCNCKVFLPIDYRIAEDIVLQPDLLIICPSVTSGKSYSGTPALVVEILSPSTALKDRNNKFYIYEAQKVPYYLITDPDKNEIEVYQLDEGQKYSLTTPQVEYTFVFPEGCTTKIDFSGIW